MNEKFYIGSAAGLAAFVASIPHGVQNYVVLMCFAVTVDMVSGIGSAIIRGHLKSSRLWDGFFRKLLQYTASLAIGGMAVVLFESWVLLNIISGAILAREVGSVLENIILAQDPGRGMGRMGDVVEFLRGIFAVGEEKHGTVVATATVIPAHPETEPSISTTTVSSINNPDRRNREG